MWVITKLRPTEKPFELPSRAKIDLEPSKGAKIFGIGVVIATVVLYIIFW